MSLPDYGIAHGRFQPPHKEHLQYLLSIGEKCHHLVVAITNPVPGTVQFVGESDHRHLAEANPFSYFQRAQMIELALHDMHFERDRFTIVPFDLFAPETWRYYLPRKDAVLYLRVFSEWEERKMAIFEENGLEVQILDRPAKKGMTATDVRQRLSNGEGIADLVPPSVAKYLHRVKDMSDAV